MSTQKEALQELLDLVEKKASTELKHDVLAWICRNLHTKHAVVELAKPMALYDLREQWALKERLAKSFAASLVSMNYDAYKELGDNTLSMSVIMLDPTNAPGLPAGTSWSEGDVPALEHKFKELGHEVK